MNTEIRNLMFDLANNKEIFDAAQNRVIPRSEANDVLRNYFTTELGLNEKSTDRDIKRAITSPEGRKFFQVTEEILDKEVTTGWADNEFFNDFVEIKSIIDGDRNDFVTHEDIILTVAKVAGDQHSLTMQNLNEDTTFSVPVSNYGMKIGGDIRMFLLGRKDWNALINAIAKAFKKMVMDEIYTEFMAAASKIPPTAQFNKTGTLSSATKDTFDTLIEDVETANNGASVTIMGTRTALSKIQGLIDVQWIADSQKEAVADSGLLGYYQGVPLIQIPQRFANNNTAVKLIDNTKLFIFPNVDLKPVKFYDGSETEVNVDGIATTQDDFKSLEVQRKMGVATVITKYFGTWSLT